MSTRKFLDLLEINNFFSQYYFPYVVYFGGKFEFFIFRKTFLMNKTRTVGQKWLVNELVNSFWAFKRCVKFQSNPIILSKLIVLKDDNNDDKQPQSQKSTLCN